MMRIFMIAALAISSRDYVANLPPDSKKYEPGVMTQRLAQISSNGGPFVPRTDPVKITSMTNTDWHQSGGMHGIKGVTTSKYKNKDAVSQYAAVQVLNDLGYYQAEMGIVRSYPDGTRFDDVLEYDGKVFEHRVRRKEDGKWTNAIVYRDPASYPPGYTGLKKTCAECHDKPGTGAYGADGLVPGGDTVFSDPLDWSVVPRR
jgi:hypothetical protein